MEAVNICVTPLKAEPLIKPIGGFPRSLGSQVNSCRSGGVRALQSGAGECLSDTASAAFLIDNHVFDKRSNGSGDSVRGKCQHSYNAAIDARYKQLGGRRCNDLPELLL
jgi:hypothetical protein